MLVTVSLLLIIASLATVHTGRVKSLEHRILLNSQNQALAGAAAEGGLAHGITRMRADPNWQGQEHTVMLTDNIRHLYSGRTLMEEVEVYRFLFGLMRILRH